MLALLVQWNVWKYSDLILWQRKVSTVTPGNTFFLRNSWKTRTCQRVGRRFYDICTSAQIWKLIQKFKFKYAADSVTCFTTLSNRLCGVLRNTSCARTPPCTGVWCCKTSKTWLEQICGSCWHILFRTGPPSINHNFQWKIERNPKSKSKIHRLKKKKCSNIFFLTNTSVLFVYLFHTCSHPCPVVGQKCDVIFLLWTFVHFAKKLHK